MYMQHYLQQAEHGSNLDVQQQMNGERRYGTYIMEYYSAIKRNEIESVVMWTNLETVIRVK